MSTDTNTNATPAKAKAKANATPRKVRGVKLSAVYAKYASKRNIDTTRAAKAVRGIMRANFDEVCKLSPNVRKHKKHANDGNRWPEVVTTKLADRILR